MQIETIETPELGDRSYLVHDGQSAIVIDPQRDTDRITALATQLGVSIELVAETHIHNDYLTGGCQLARDLGARYVVSAGDRVSFRRLAVADGDELIAGDLTIRVIATPGHTLTHLAYAVSGPGRAPAVFTGGSLLHGAVGRTDLAGPELTRELTGAQFRSARRLAARLPGTTTVHPTHGFGSFCSASAGPATGRDSTIGRERIRNPALTAASETAFSDELLAGLGSNPSYYAQMAPLNRCGPGPAELSLPPRLDPAGLAARIAAGDWVIDLRGAAAFAASHLAGTVSIPLGPQFATYAGWVTTWGAPLVLTGESEWQIRDARRQLTRIGLDRVTGACWGPVAAWGTGRPAGRYPRASFADLPPGLAAAPADGTGPSAGSAGGAGEAAGVLLDVRRAQEFAAGHRDGAVNIPVGELPGRLAEVPAGRVWVHCAAGYRAGIAASLLARAGRDVVHVDDSYPGPAAIPAGPAPAGRSRPAA